MFDFDFDTHQIPSPSGVPYFGLPNAGSMQRAMELAKAEKVRAVFDQIRKRYGRERQQREREYDQARTPPLSMDWGLEVHNARETLRALVSHIRAEWKYGLAAAGLREEDWKVTGNMTSKERAKYNKLLSTPKLDDEIKPSAAPKHIPARVTPEPCSILKKLKKKQPRSRVRVQPNNEVHVSVVMYISESGDETDKDNEVELAVLPTLTAKQRAYLESVGFFSMLEGKARAMEEKFRWEVEKQMMTHWRHHVDIFAMEDPQAVQRRIQREVGKELRDKCQVQVQDIFEKHMSKLFLQVVAEEWGIKLGHEEMQYLKRVGFPERVDEIHAEAERGKLEQTPRS
ncbi:hypothetical protein DENSPDRAFT_851757 [Dentipellis sp. KUC8613]|nr:hypothetical protein DENSPDRAFT_851757 [Dentipellis sp. KUC8613]